MRRCLRAVSAKDRGATPWGAADGTKSQSPNPLTRHRIARERSFTRGDDEYMWLGMGCIPVISQRYTS